MKHPFTGAARVAAIVAAVVLPSFAGAQGAAVARGDAADRPVPSPAHAVTARW